MKRVGTVIGILMTGASIGPFAEAQTVYGPSGLLFSPSAYTQPQNSVGFGLSTFTVERPNNEPRWWSASVDYGATERAEVGLTFLHQTNGDIRNSFGVFGKYQWLPETDQRPAVAVGLDLIGGDLRSTQAYLVGTKRLTTLGDPNAATVSAGIAYVWDRDGRERNSTDVFGGFNLQFAPHLELVAELRSRTNLNLKMTSGAALVYRGNNYSLAIGLVNTGNSRNHTFFIGAGFNVETVD